MTDVQAATQPCGKPRPEDGATCLLRPGHSGFCWAGPYPESELDQLRSAAMQVVVEYRPTHEHYENPSGCSLCNLFLVLGVETYEEQQEGFDD